MSSTAAKMSEIRRTHALLSPRAPFLQRANNLFYEDDYGNVICPAADPGSLTSYHNDHTTPRNLGGPTTAANLLPIAAKANAVKSAKTISDRTSASTVSKGDLMTGINTRQVVAMDKFLRSERKGRDLSYRLRRVLCKSPPKGVRWGTRFQDMFKTYLERDREEGRIKWADGKEDGALLFEYLDAFVCDGSKAARGAGGGGAPRVEGRSPWSEQEVRLFEEAMGKHGGAKDKYAAILRDREEGTWGAVYGVKGKRDGVALKDKAAHLKGGGAGAKGGVVVSRKRGREGKVDVVQNVQRKPALDRNASRVKWTGEETAAFLEAVRKHGKGKWMEIKEDRAAGSYGQRFGAVRSSGHLQSRYRTLQKQQQQQQQQ